MGDKFVIDCGDWEPSTNRSTSPMKGWGCPTCFEILGTPHHLYQGYSLTCQTALLHSQMRKSEGYIMPSCPYFVLWLPNFASAISGLACLCSKEDWLEDLLAALEQELHLLKKQKTAQCTPHPWAVSAAKSPTAWNNQSTKGIALLNMKVLPQNQFSECKVHDGCKDTSLKSSRNSSRKRRENILHHSTMLPEVHVKLEPCLETAYTISTRV